MDKDKFLKIIKGFDTETILGYCRLIAIEDEVYEVKSLDEILNVLSQYRFLVSYNLDYDVTSIIKYLKSEDIQKILRGIEVRYKEYKIRYLKNKIFILSCNHSKTEIYDCLQYFNLSLDTASKKFLGESKLGDYGKRITEENIYTDEIKKYCIQDSQLCKKLFVYFYKDLPFRNFIKPLSSGFLSYNYFKKEIKENQFRGGKIFQNAYYGGRFEVFKRGYFENVYYADINSCYPFQISRLYSLKDCYVIEGNDYHRNCDYGCYKVKVRISNKDFSVVPIRYKGLIIYPRGFFTCWVTKSEMEVLMKNNEVVDILKSYEVFTHQKYVFRDKIYDLYEKRKKYDIYAYKIILNSLYGKFAQSIMKRSKNLEYVNDLKSLEFYHDEVFSKYEDTSISNFLYASEITARGRRMIYDVLEENYKYIIAVFTDCVISTKKLKLEYGDKLGQWKWEKWDKLWMIGPGVYFYEKDGKIYGHYRGFSISDSEKMLEKILKSKTSYVNIDITERLSAFIYSKELINIIVNKYKKLNLNFDSKRIWADKFKNGKEIEKKVITSKTICYFCNKFLLK